MLRLNALICSIAIFSSVSGLPPVNDRVYDDDYHAVIHRAMLKPFPGSVEADGYELKENELGFSWNNCGSKDDVVQIKSLNLSPDPVIIPGNATISHDVIIAEDIMAPTSLALVVKKKLFGVFIEVPCVDEIGSCIYENPCNLWYKLKSCPEILIKQGIMCRCPIKKGDYKLSPFTFKIPKIKLPKFIEDGEYQIQATLMKGKTRLACYQIQASLKAKTHISV